jgi:polysaccharide chain length determinant protein (PEP-CTERM system associated)
MDEIYRRALITLRGMWKHRWLGLGVAWVVGAVALAFLSLIPARYEATARIFANTDSILKPLMTGMTVQPNEDQRIVLLSRVVISRPNVERLVTTVGLDADAKTKEDRERIIDKVTRTLGLKGTGRDNLYTLAFSDENPARAKRAVELLTAMFIESSRGGKTDDTEAAKRFLDEQITVYDAKLRETENRLKDFKLRNLGNTPAEGRDFFVRMADTERALSQARLELREAERSRDAYRRGLASEGPSATISATDAAAATTTTEIEARSAAQRVALDGMLQRYTENHPDVQGARRVIRELEEQRRLMVTPSGAPIVAPSAVGGPRAVESLKVSLAQSEAQVAALSARVAEHAARYERLKATASQVPQLEAELVQLNRDYEVNKKNYENLVQRRESASISGDMQSVSGMGDFRLVDPPRVSSRPVSPNRLLLFPLALLLALGAGIAAAYIAREVRPAFFDSRSLREATGLPMLGVVSQVVNAPQRIAERRGVYRFVGGVAALFVVYSVGFITLELLGSHVI